METNILELKNRIEFRDWLQNNSKTESECYIIVKRGKPVDPDIFYYLDAVEEAICFGWIDSTYKEINGIRMQRFTPRKKNSPWTELNKERARRLIKLGLMEESGLKSLPPLGNKSFKFDDDIIKALKENKCYKTFRSFPLLYQRIRAYNIQFYKKRYPDIYEKSLNHLIEETKKGNMYGEWNDYERLLNY